MFHLVRLVVRTDVCLVTTSAHPQHTGLAENSRAGRRHDGRRPALCPCGRVYSCANMDLPSGGESILVQTWNSPQGAQVHYTNVAVGH